MPPASAATAPRKPAASAATPPRKPEARSRVTNGSDILPGIDGRSLIARRYRDICAALAADQGGAADMSEARGQLIRRFAALAVQCEAMEARLANGAAIDIAEYATLTSTLVRVAARIGINRIPRDVTPTLAQYLASKERPE
jgi:hypothetical protein